MPKALPKRVRDQSNKRDQDTQAKRVITHGAFRHISASEALKNETGECLFNELNTMKQNKVAITPKKIDSLWKAHCSNSGVAIALRTLCVRLGIHA